MPVTTDGFIGLFAANTTNKIDSYIALLRGSIYEYLSVELFEDATYCYSGSSFIDNVQQRLKFTAINDTYISKDLVNKTVNTSIVTTWNEDCIFYADYSGAPLFYVRDDVNGWTAITSGSQYLKGSATNTWEVKIAATTSNDIVNSFGIIYGRKPKFRTIITTDV